MMRDQRDNKLDLSENGATRRDGDASSSDVGLRSRNYIFIPTDSLQFRIVDDTRRSDSARRPVIRVAARRCVYPSRLACGNGRVAVVRARALAGLHGADVPVRVSGCIQVVRSAFGAPPSTAVRALPSAAVQ